MKLSKSDLKSIRLTLEKKLQKTPAAAEHKPLLDILAGLDVESLGADEVATLKANFVEALNAFVAEAAKEEKPKEEAPKEEPKPGEQQEEPKEEPKPVEQEEVQAHVSLEEYVELAADKKLLEREVARLTAQVAELTTQNQELSTKAANSDSLTASVEAATQFLKLECQNVLIMAGFSQPTVPDTIPELVTTVRATRETLKGKFPVGGVGHQITAQGQGGQETAPKKLRSVTNRK